MDSVGCTHICMQQSYGRGHESERELGEGKSWVGRGVGRGRSESDVKDSTHVKFSKKMRKK